MDRLSLHRILCPWGRQRQEAGAGGETVRAPGICVGPLPGGGWGVRSKVGTGGRAIGGKAQGPGRWRENGCLWAQPQPGVGAAGASLHEAAGPRGSCL